MRLYHRPLVQFAAPRPQGAVPVAGGPGWFTHAERLRRGAAPVVVAAADVPQAERARISAPRAALGEMTLTTPRILGILNVTPDSFSDGGVFRGAGQAVAAALEMADAGADMLDIGGESTRPGARLVPEAEEISRIVPVIAGLREQSDVRISVDTRKAGVARAAVAAGANLVNDVSGLTYDPGLAPFCAAQGLPVCVMHMQGDPETMQDTPEYGDVLLDVFDHLDARIEALGAEGIERAQILVDPGIGFGKTVEHNLALLRRISLLHGLGCGILLGVSRKGFIGRIGGAAQARARFPGSVAVALAAIAQGVQVVRVHDVAETAQALRLWNAVARGDG